MPHADRTPLEEAERRLTMNLSLVAMLKKNTTDEQIAKLRRLWVQPVEEHLRDLRSQCTMADPMDPAEGGMINGPGATP